MNSIITLSAAEEALLVDGAAHAVGVQLNFELLEEVADGAQAFRDFLDTLPDLRFALYLLDGDTLKRQAMLETLDSTPDPAAGWTGRILDWLAAGTPQWHGERPDDATLTAASRISAGQRLGSSHNWPAPLPQQAGLNRMLELNNAVTSGLYILPFPWSGGDAEPQAQYATQDLGGGARRVELPWGASHPSLEVSPIEPKPSVNGITKGWLDKSPLDGDALRLLDAVRGKSGALFWTAPQVIALAPLKPTELEDEQDDADVRERMVRQLAWRAAQGFTTLFDTFLMSIDLGGGERLGPLVQSVLAAAEQIDPELPQPTLDGYAAAVVEWKRNLAAGSWANFAMTAADLIDQPGLTAQFESPALQANGDEVLPFLLACAASATFNDPGDDFDAAGMEAQLDQELSALVQQMGDEQGYEAMLLRFLRGARTNSGDARTLLEAIFYVAPQLIDTANLSGTELEAARKTNGEMLEKAHRNARGKASRAIDTLASLFADDYNGLEAARQAAGRLFLEKLMAKAQSSEESPATLLAEAAWFADRTAARNGHFGDIAAALPHCPVNAMPHQTDVDELDKAWASVCEDITAGTGSAARRFVPDTHPQDLPVYLPMPHVVEASDSFEEHYDGIALLVRQRGAAKFAHANLVDLVRPVGEPPIVLQADALMPQMPATEDGERSLTFDYSGMFMALALPPDPDADDEDEGGPLPFYQPLPPDQPGNGYAYPPPLAYGTAYDFAAFAVSRNGLLPDGVASGASHAARLVPDPDPLVDASQLNSFEYSRRTGIGRTSLERPGGQSAQTLEKREDGLVPLFADYPRVALCAKDASSSWLDLGRAADGNGTLALPGAEGASVSIQLSELARLGSGRITISLLTSPKPTDSDFSSTSVDLALLGDNAEIEIRRIGSKCEVGLGGQELHSVDAADHGWLRVALTADTGQEAILTLGDPAGEVEGNTAAPSPGEFVLLSPGSSDWLESYAQKANFTVTPPSMGLADFDRWLANPVLLGEHPDTDANDAPLVPQPVLTQAELLLELLHTLALDAYGETAELLQTYGGMLPDLAVDHVVAELCTINQLGKQDHGISWEEPKLIPSLKLSELVSKAGGLETEKDEDGNDLGVVIPADLPGFLAAMAQARQISLVTVCAGSGKPELEFNSTTRQLTARVPAGHTARLRLRPAVRKAHFAGLNGNPPVIEPGLAHYATGASAEHLLFDGPVVTIEAMDLPDDAVAGNLLALAQEPLKVEAAAASRSYSLVMRPSENADGALAWRWCARAEVTSQRWRHLGRPVSKWFAPRENASSKAKGDHGPILPIRESKAVLDFESEAFDRPDADSQSAVVRLAPAGEASVLHEGSWEQPSATLFRHRIALENRYASALAKGRGKRRWTIIHRQGGGSEGWLRVAVLADRSRIRLNRPQLRALIPLPQPTTAAPTPPIMAMLAEPPFANGGLADRIAAGLATGFGYAMKDDGAGSQLLGIADARQEFGSDPQLTYRDLDPALRQAIGIAGDGPIGLTFDREAGTSAAFPNSAWLFTPDALSKASAKADLQEHFAWISLKRYLDPAWIAVEPEPEAEPDPAEQQASLPFAETRWIEAGEGGCKFSLASGLEFATVSKTTHGPWTVTTQEKAILPEAPAPGTTALELCRFDGDDVTGCALLHQPLDAKRASLAVFALVSNGLPRMMASFDWVSEDAVGEITLSGAFTKVWKTSASLATDMNWTRTARDIGKVEAQAEGSSQTLPVPVETLSISANGTSLFGLGGRACWLRPSLHDAAVPLHLQRFLAILPTAPVTGIGRAIDTYSPESHPARLLLARTLAADTVPAGGEAHLLEVELPARPLLAGKIGDVPPEYSAPEFNLQECGISGCPGLLLLVRPIVGNRSINAELVLTVKARGRTVTCTVAASKVLDQIVLYIDMASLNASGWTVDGAGKDEVAVCAAPEGSAEIGDRVTVSLALAGDALDTAWRGSVAILSAHGKPGSLQEIALDFEWLFGNPQAGEEGEFANALSHQALRDTRGAQARIIAVTDPIGRPETG